MDLSDDVMRALANQKPNVIQRILIILRMQVDKFLARQGRSRQEIDLNFAKNMDEKDSYTKKYEKGKENNFVKDQQATAEADSSK